MSATSENGNHIHIYRGKPVSRNGAHAHELPAEIEATLDAHETRLDALETATPGAPHSHPELDDHETRIESLETAPVDPHTHAELEETPEIVVLRNQVVDLEARLATLESSGGGGGGTPPAGTTGSLTVKGKLRVEGEIELLALQGPASRAITIIIPDGAQYDASYASIRWIRSGKYLFGLVAHEVATDGSIHKHFSMYRGMSNGTDRESVFDYDFWTGNVGQTPHPYLDIENTEVRLNKGSKIYDRNGNEILG